MPLAYDISTEEQLARVSGEGAADFDGPGDAGYVAVVVKPSRIEYMEMGASRPELWNI